MNPLVCINGIPPVFPSRENYAHDLLATRFTLLLKLVKCQETLITKGLIKKECKYTLQL